MATGRMQKHHYSNEFKIIAIRLASLPGTLIQDVARVLDIHPFMLSRWKKEYREGKIPGEPHPNIENLAEMEEKVSEQKRIRELEAALKKAQIENDLLKKAIRFRISINRSYHSQDNAHMESFFHSIKAEWIRGRSFESFEHLESALGTYMRFYNRARLHSGIDSHTPREYEKRVVD